MKPFLLVEDSPIIVKIIRHVCKQHPDMQCEVASSMAEAKSILEAKGTEYYLAAVVDLNLPDAPNGEIVDFSIVQGLPTLVMTGNFDDEVREQMLQKRIIDYVVKESRFSYEYVIKQIRRLENNQSIRILVVDDSKMSRKHISQLLKTQLFQVCEAENGAEALTIIQQDASIRLIITDYNMPVMNGFDLVRNIRAEADKNDLVIIGLSGEGDSKLSAKFIKNGANDFLSKPFGPEEFNCRILHNIETMEHLQTMRHMAYHDYATGLPNKRKFFEEGSELLLETQNRSAPSCLALLAIDNIHQLQDRYGLDACETTLRNLADLLPKAFERFHYARLSDAEIAILLPGLDQQKAFTLMESFRALIEGQIVLLDELNFNYSVSVGLSQDQKNSLIELLTKADNQLHLAQEDGGNQVMGETG